MRIPPVLYKGRTAIEGLVPRNTPISANVHVAAGVLTAAAVLAGVYLLAPKHDSATPQRFDRHAVDRLGPLAVGTAATAGLVLTAGMQLSSPALPMMKNGISPMYFWFAGMIFGSGFLLYQVGQALSK